MSNTSTSETTLVCANCGKEGSEVTNTCNKCKEVMYCNAACKKRHRHKHKKECERRVAELHDEKLFKQPPPMEDCPICFLRLPSLMSGSTYMACCGKMICCGCVYAPVYDHEGSVIPEKTCPFCRTKFPRRINRIRNRSSDEKWIEMTNKRVDMNDARAIHSMGVYYSNGLYGLPQNMAKALKLWHRAVELGHALTYCNIGVAHMAGRGVEVDHNKAKHSFELAAMGGDVEARHNLGYMEWQAGNMDRALKHFMIAVKGGNLRSLDNIKEMYENRQTTKDDYAKALQTYQAYLDEIKSDQRDKAAAANGSPYYGMPSKLQLMH